MNRKKKSNIPASHHSYSNNTSFSPRSAVLGGILGISNKSWYIQTVGHLPAVFVYTLSRIQLTHTNHYSIMHGLHIHALHTTKWSSERAWMCMSARFSNEQTSAFYMVLLCIYFTCIVGAFFNAGSRNSQIYI